MTGISIGFDDRTLGDDDKLYFGSDKDFSVYYGSTNNKLYINDEAGNGRPVNAYIEEVDATRNLLPEGAQTGLAADTTGVKYSGATNQKVDSWLLIGNRSVYIEAATASSAGDEVVTVEVYDMSAAAVVDSFTISGGSKRARSVDISANLTTGNDVYVRFNVTTASATSGATFDALSARLIIE